MNYVTRRIKVKAIQFSGLNRDEITAFCNDSEVIYRRPRVNQHHELLIRTDENDIRIEERDWILKFEDGTLSGCDNDIFKYYYEPEVEAAINYSEPNWEALGHALDFIKDDQRKELERIQSNDKFMLKVNYLEMMNKLKGEEDEHNDTK